MVYSVLKIWDCDTLLPKDIVFFREESDKVRMFSRDENGRYKKITQQNTAFSTKKMYQYLWSTKKLISKNTIQIRLIM